MAADLSRVQRNPLEEAKESRDALASALQRADIRLLALRLDPCASAGEVAHPLVDLGRCSPRTARALAVLIERGAAR